jgi:hypothetical protein
MERTPPTFETDLIRGSTLCKENFPPERDIIPKTEKEEHLPQDSYHKTKVPLGGEKAPER